MSDYLNYALVIATFVFGALSLYFKSRKDITTLIASFICTAEDMYKDSTKAGGKKFSWVVSKIHNKFPFISEKNIETLVQITFDSMETYAKMQLDKYVKVKE